MNPNVDSKVEWKKGNLGRITQKQYKQYYNRMNKTEICDEQEHKDRTTDSGTDTGDLPENTWTKYKKRNELINHRWHKTGVKKTD